MAAPGGAATAEDGAAAAANAEAPPALPRKIIYTATVNLVTDDLSEAARLLALRVKEMNGYVASASLTGSPGSPRAANWTVRIPVARFDDFLGGMRKLGTLESTNTNSQDVSEEFYDLEARLKNKRIEETRLLDHLRQSTARLSDILAVEREISRVREEIERMEGRARFLANQTDLTTVTITIREEKDFVPAKPPTFGSRMADTFRASRDALGGFIQAVVLLLVAFLPWLAAAALVGVPVSVAMRRSRAASAQRRRSRTPDEEDRSKL